MGGIRVMAGFRGDCRFIRRGLVIAALLLPPLAIGRASAEACEGQGEEVRYFRTLAEVVSFVEPVAGVGEIAEEVAMEVAHFRLVRDGCGDLARVRYFHGRTPKPIDENFTANRLTPSSSMAFHRSGEVVEIRYSDHNDRPVPVFGGVAATRLKYSEEGRLESAAFFDGEGAPALSALGYASARWVWNGRDAAAEYRYDEEGRSVSAGPHLAFSAGELALDARGFVKTIRPSPGEVHIRFDRDEDGKLLSWRLYEGDLLFSDEASGLAGMSYGYDRNDYLERATYFDETGAPAVAQSGHMGFVRTYADSGNRLGYHFVDSHGDVWMPPARGYAGQRYQWRDDGVVRIRAEYVDEHGELMDHPTRGYAAIDYAFDADNDVTRETFLTAEGEVLPEGN